MYRHGLDPTLLWLWCRLAATALIRPLAWVSPRAAGAALKRKKKKELNHNLLILISDCVIHKSFSLLILITEILIMPSF